MKRFIVDNSGTVSVDWVVLTVATISLVTLGMGFVSTSSVELASTIELSIIETPLGMTDVSKEDQ